MQLILAERCFMNKNLKAYLYLSVFTVAVTSHMLWGMDKNVPFYQQYEAHGFTFKNIVWPQLKKKMPQLKEMPDLRNSLKNAFWNEGWRFRKYEKPRLTLLGVVLLKHTYITKQRNRDWENGIEVRKRAEELLHENPYEVTGRTKRLLCYALFASSFTLGCVIGSFISPFFR